MKSIILVGVILLVASPASGQYYGGSFHITYGRSGPTHWNYFSAPPTRSRSYSGPVVRGSPMHGTSGSYRAPGTTVHPETAQAKSILGSVKLPPIMAEPRIVMPDPKKTSPGPTLTAQRPPMTPVDPKSDMSPEAQKNWDIVTGETRDKVIEKFACDVADRGEKILQTKTGEAAKAAGKLTQASAAKAAATKELQQSSVDLARARSKAAARTGTPVQMAKREAGLIRAENRAAKAFAKTAQAEAKEALAKGATEVAAKQSGKQFAKQVVKKFIAGAAKVVSRAGTYFIMLDAAPTAPKSLDELPPPDK